MHLLLGKKVLFGSSNITQNKAAEIGGALVAVAVKEVAFEEMTVSDNKVTGAIS